MYSSIFQLQNDLTDLTLIEIQKILMLIYTYFITIKTKLYEN